MESKYKFGAIGKVLKGEKDVITAFWKNKQKSFTNQFQAVPAGAIAGHPKKIS